MNDNLGELLKELKRPDQKMVDVILREEESREKLYPLSSMVDVLRSEFKHIIFEGMPALVAEGPPEKILGRILDKMKLAEEFIDLHPMYYDNAGMFWSWNNQECFWEPIDELDVISMIERSAEVNVINNNEKSQIMNALKLTARRREPKPIPATSIQFGKEIVDLATGERLPSSPRYFVTNPLPHRLGSSQETPKFDKLFSEWVRPEDVAKLYEILAYCMVPSYPIERTFCLYGSGSNGKSVFRTIVRRFIGHKNVCSTSLGLLTSSPRFEPAKLYKKLVCEMGETNLSKLENTEIIKKLVSGKDLIGGEWKNKGQFDFLNYAKLLISTNNIPPTEDKTDGFYRKWLIIDFPNTFPTEHDVLVDITEEDYQNLACRCLHVLDDLLKRRSFTNEGTFQQRRERYEERSNPLEKFYHLFIDDGDPNADVPKWEFEKRLNEWCRENRHRNMSDLSIGRVMKSKGISEVRLRKQWYENNQGVERMMRCWAGIKWK